MSRLSLTPPRNKGPVWDAPDFDEMNEQVIKEQVRRFGTVPVTLMKKDSPQEKKESFLEKHRKGQKLNQDQLYWTTTDEPPLQEEPAHKQETTPQTSNLTREIKAKQSAEAQQNRKKRTNKNSQTVKSTRKAQKKPSSRSRTQKRHSTLPTRQNQGKPGSNSERATEESKKRNPNDKLLKLTQTNIDDSQSAGETRSMTSTTQLRGSRKSRRSQPSPLMVERPVDFPGTPRFYSLGSLKSLKAVIEDKEKEEPGWLQPTAKQRLKLYNPIYKAFEEAMARKNFLECLSIIDDNKKAFPTETILDLIDKYDLQEYVYQFERYLKPPEELKMMQKNFSTKFSTSTSSGEDGEGKGSKDDNEWILIFPGTALLAMLSRRGYQLPILTDICKRLSLAELEQASDLLYSENLDLYLELYSKLIKARDLNKELGDAILRNRWLEVDYLLDKNRLRINAEQLIAAFKKHLSLHWAMLEILKKNFAAQHNMVDSILGMLHHQIPDSTLQLYIKDCIPDGERSTVLQKAYCTEHNADMQKRLQLIVDSLFRFNFPDAVKPEDEVTFEKWPQLDCTLKDIKHDAKKETPIHEPNFNKLTIKTASKDTDAKSSSADVKENKGMPLFVSTSRPSIFRPNSNEFAVTIKNDKTTIASNRPSSATLKSENPLHSKGSTDKKALSLATDILPGEIPQASLITDSSSPIGSPESSPTTQDPSPISITPPKLPSTRPDLSKQIAALRKANEVRRSVSIILPQHQTSPQPSSPKPQQPSFPRNPPLSTQVKEQLRESKTPQVLFPPMIEKIDDLITLT